MREAVGGSLLFYMIIPVLFIVITFIAFIMNYASTYRAANYIITQIETCDANLNSCTHIESRDKMEQTVRSKYHYTGNITYSCSDNSKGSVYKASLYVSFELPLLGNIGVYRIDSESKTIYNVSCSESKGII